MNMNSPRFAPPVYRNGAGNRMFMPRSSAAAQDPLGALGGAPGMGPDGRTIFPGGNNNPVATTTTNAAATAGGGNGHGHGTTTTPPSTGAAVNTQIVNPVFSPRASQITKTIRDPRASPKSDEDAKELHMFVWSANASPVTEAGLHVFGGNDPVPADFDPKEVRMLVHPQSDRANTAGGWIIIPFPQLHFQCDCFGLLFSESNAFEVGSLG